MAGVGRVTKCSKMERAGSQTRQSPAREATVMRERFSIYLDSVLTLVATTQCILQTVVAQDAPTMKARLQVHPHLLLKHHLPKFVFGMTLNCERGSHTALLLM
jgi:hypothetical protein